jgi:hypothetical protein
MVLVGVMTVPKCSLSAVAQVRLLGSSERRDMSSEVKMVLLACKVKKEGKPTGSVRKERARFKNRERKSKNE